MSPDVWKFSRHMDIPNRPVGSLGERPDAVNPRQSAYPRLEAAAAVVYEAMGATPQHRWPLLDARCGTAVWVKHENQTPVGAFKVRGGLVYFDALRARRPTVKGVVGATRGNHGQSIGFAAARYGIPTALVVPRGNSVGKNRAMRALGVELIERGARLPGLARSGRPASRPNGDGTFSPRFIRSSCAAWRLTRWNSCGPRRDLDTLYVPIGLGSGICGAMAARDALGAGHEHRRRRVGRCARVRAIALSAARWCRTR